MLPLVVELKYLGVLFMSEGRVEIVRQIGASSVFGWKDHKAVDLIYVPTLTCGHTALGSDQKNEMVDISSGNEFPQKGGWPLSKEASWGGSVSNWDQLWARCSRHVLLGGGLEVDPGQAGEITSLNWFGNTLVSPGWAGGDDWEEGGLDVPA